MRRLLGRARAEATESADGRPASGRGLRLAFVVPRYGQDVVGGAETLVRGLAEHLAASGSAVEVLTTCARDHLTWTNALPAGATREGGVVVRRFPVRLRDTRRHAWLQLRILRGSPLRPKEEARWADESVGSTELFDHLTRRQGDYDLVCFAPYLFGTTLRAARRWPSPSDPT